MIPQNYRPQITSNLSGKWIVIWEEGGVIQITTSTDNGNSWNAVGIIATGGRGPRTASDGSDAWIATWDTGGAIYHSISNDNGATWGTPMKLFPSGSPAYLEINTSATLATDGTGTWVNVWWSGESDAMGGVHNAIVKFAKSTDNGESWSAGAAIHTKAASRTTLATWFSPALSTDKAGNWVVAWNSIDSLAGSIGSDYDILFAGFQDNSVIWINFASPDGGDGSYADPYNNLAEAIAEVVPGGTIKLFAGSTSNGSPPISKKVKLEAPEGVVRIGVSP